MRHFKLYTDGACNSSGNNAGGWAFLLEEEREFIQCGYGGSKLATTNNRMELFAIYAGLKQIPDDSEVTVHTDSQYCRQIFIKWYRVWEANNWFNHTGDAVKNRNLIIRIGQEMKRIGRVRVVHIKRNTTPEMVWVDERAKGGKRDDSWYIGKVPARYSLLSKADIELKESIAFLRSLQKKCKKPQRKQR